MENSTQKISKISVSSSDADSNYSSEYESNSVEYERTPQNSGKLGQYSDLISALSLTLGQRKIPHDQLDGSYSNLQVLIKTLCLEYKKQTLNQETNNAPTCAVVDKLLIGEHSSVALDLDERNQVLRLLVELMRQGDKERVAKRVEVLKNTLSQTSRTVESLREEIEAKDKEIAELRKKKKKSFGFKKNRYLESESTLNESQDTFM